MLDSRLVHVKTHTRGKGKNKTKQNKTGVGKKINAQVRQTKT